MRRLTAGTAGWAVGLLAVILCTSIPAGGAPFSKELLIRALAVGGLDESAMARAIDSQKVDFVLTPEVERELRRAGASDSLVRAIRDNGPAAVTPGEPEGSQTPAAAAATGAASPLEKDQILLAMQAGATQQRLAEMVEQRGLAFQLTPEIGRELQQAGASATLIAALAVARTEAGAANSVPVTTELPDGFIPLPAERAGDFDPYASRGQLDLRIFVDGVSEIRIQDDRIIHTNVEARLGRNAGTAYTQPLPRQALSSLEIVQKEGRGKWALIQRPNAENGYQLVIRISDPKGGEDRYHLQIQWER